MARIILVTGGSRSGKSAHALKLARGLDGPRLFVATCPALDDEMRLRIRKHQDARRADGWQTLEEPLDLAGAIERAAEYRVVLVDCLTLWINNLLYAAEQTGVALEEGDVPPRCEALLQACARHDGTVIFVTNEVGWGIVPDNALARRFRDMSGRCNSIMAAGADEVVLLACGLPLYLKKGH